MIDHLFPYYERELRFINLLTREFAQRHPAAAMRLGLESTGSSDPYVQRLLESFALLAGRTHAKIEDEFPELTDALLQFLYPHFLAPIPSMALVQMEADPARVQLPRGFLIPPGSVIDVATEPISSKFRTVYPVTLWPIRVTRASFRAPPFPPGLRPPETAVAALRLELECVGELSFAQLELESLRFFLLNDPQLTPDLYEVLLNHALQVIFLPSRAPADRSPVVLHPRDCLAPVGFEREEGLLPYPENARLGYRLMTEFFTFPAKFHFFDLGGWSRGSADLGHRCEVVIFLDKTLKSLEQGVDTETFRLGCTPVVNLFSKTAEPIALRPRQSEYRIVADRMSPQSVEVYSVTQVSSSDPVENRTTVYPPFFAMAHARGATDGGIFSYATRRRSFVENDQGTEMFLSLVNLHFEPRWPADENLQVQVLCTNRDLPLQIALAGDSMTWNPEFPAPLQGVKCLRPPSPPLRPAARSGSYWELISHLSPSPFSLQEGPGGRAALLDILRLYDFSDPAAGQKHLRDQALQIVEGLLSVSYRRVLGRVPSDPQRGLCRGIEITVELDPGKFPSRGAFLFAAVLNRFFGLYATTNSFTQLIAKMPKGEPTKWPARTGEIPLL